MKKLHAIKLFGLLLIFILLMSAPIPSAVAYAADDDVAPHNYIYDKTDVTKDLAGSEGFDFSQYPADASKETQIYTFLEYGYDGADNSKFGLYIYVYNPKQKSFSTSSASNRANVAMAFDGKDNATSYQRVGLIFCSATSDKLFYKFRIDDGDGKLLALAEKYALTHGGARRYDIATVELFAYGDKTATTSTIGKSYECTGYMKGFGADKENNTHSVKAYSLDVLDIELNHTFFRPDGKGYAFAGDDYFRIASKDQLDSVYFSFPNELIEQYGGIWKIEAGFYKMATRPIFITSVKEVYDIAYNYVGRDNRGESNAKFFSYFPKRICDTILNDMDYSDELKEEARNFLLCNFPNTPIYYLFYTGYKTEDGSVPYAKDFNLSSERLLNYIYGYTRSFNNGTLDIKDGISKDLFLYTPEYENAGYGQYTDIDITADEKYTLENLSREQHWYDFLDAFGLSAEYQSDAYRNIQAILPIDKSDVSLSKSEFCQKYLVFEADYDDIIKSVNKDDETTYLFRFAQSSYETLGLKSQVGNGYTFDAEYNYCSREDAYLDMNLASITCRKNDEYHTFAVASNPIDAVADIDPPPEDFDNTGWWKDQAEKVKSTFEDLIEKIKSFFDKQKRDLTIALIVIVCLTLLVAILIIAFKLTAHRPRAQAPPMPSRQKSRKQNKK